METQTSSQLGSPLAIDSNDRFASGRTLQSNKRRICKLSTDLNISSIRDSRQLTDGFFWPIPDSDKEALYRDIRAAWSELINWAHDSEHEALVKVVSVFMQGIMFNVFYNALLAMKVERKISVNGFKASDVDYLSHFVGNVDGFAKIDYIDEHFINYTEPIQVARFARAMVNRPKETVAALYPSPTALVYFKKNNLFPEECSFYHWYTPLHRFDTRKLASSTLVDKICATVESHVKNYEFISEFLGRWQKEFVTYSLSQVGHRLNQVRSNPLVKQIIRLYTPTQGKIMTRIISTAVRENGGIVVGFPHAGGCLCLSPNAWMVEALTANTFYCYTALEKERRQTQAKYFFKLCNTNFTILPNDDFDVQVKTIEQEIKTVMFLSGCYFGDRVYVDVVHEIQRFDLELKILEAIVRNQKQVIVKLHRKSRSLEQMKNLLIAKFGDKVQIDDTPLSDLLNQGVKADAFVSENISGGALLEVIKTDKPVILFSTFWDSSAYLDEALTIEKEVFRKRVMTVPCRWDGNHRAIFNETLFSEYLHRQKYVIDHEASRLSCNSLFPY